MICFIFQWNIIQTILLILHWMPLNCRVCSQCVGYVVGTTTFGRVSATRFTEFVLNEVGSATRITEFVLYKAELAVSLRESLPLTHLTVLCFVLCADLRPLVVMLWLHLENGFYIYGIWQRIQVHAMYPVHFPVLLCCHDPKFFPQQCQSHSSG